MPNGNQQTLSPRFFDLNKQERSGLLIGSLLTAGAALAGGRGGGQNLTRALIGGSLAYGRGKEAIMRQKNQLIEQAARQMQLQEAQQQAARAASAETRRAQLFPLQLAQQQAAVEMLPLERQELIGQAARRTAEEQRRAELYPLTLEQQRLGLQEAQQQAAVTEQTQEAETQLRLNQIAAEQQRLQFASPEQMTARAAQLIQPTQWETGLLDVLSEGERRGYQARAESLLQTGDPAGALSVYERALKEAESRRVAIRPEPPRRLPENLARNVTALIDQDYASLVRPTKEDEDAIMEGKIARTDLVPRRLSAKQRRERLAELNAVLKIAKERNLDSASAYAIYRGGGAPTAAPPSPAPSPTPRLMTVGPDGKMRPLTEAELQGLGR